MISTDKKQFIITLMIFNTDEELFFSSLYTGRNPPDDLFKTTRGLCCYALLWYSEDIKGMKRRSHMTFNKVKSATLNLNSRGKS